MLFKFDQEVLAKFVTNSQKTFKHLLYFVFPLRLKKNKNKKIKSSCVSVPKTLNLNARVHVQP